MAPPDATLLNSHLLLHFELNDPLPRITTLIQERPAIKGALAERMLLYDRLIIPTADFSILPVLVTWLGQDLLTEMLAAGAIRFLRYYGSLGYAGNGNGLCMFQIEKSEAQTWKDPWQEAPGARTERAAEIWLRLATPGLTSKTRDRIISSVVEHSDELKAVPEFENKIAHETYMDGLNSPSLRTFFGLRSTNMTRLHGVDPNQLKVFSPQNIHVQGNPDEVTVLLGMAAANFELYLAELTGARDVAFDPSIEPFLVGKAERALHSMELAKGFVDILNVNDLPDLATAVQLGEVTPAEVWRLRNRQSAIDFRRWFHENVREEPERAAKEYVAAIGRVTWMDKVPGKVLRFAVTSAASLLGPAAGLVTSAFDSFLLESIVRGHSPKYLIDDLSRVLPRAADTARR